MRTVLLTVALVIPSFLVATAGVLYGRYGGSEPYQDLSTTPAFDESVLETVVTSSEPIGNVAVSSTGRIFYTIHPESRPEGAKLMEWQDGAAVAYPSAEQQALFETVLGVAIDREERLWTIDHGNHGTGRTRLLAFDLRNDEVVHDHTFGADAAPLGSFLQDLNVDITGQHVFVADVSFWRQDAAVVVYNIATQNARRVLEDHASVSPQDWLIRTPTKDMRFFGGLVDLKPGIDGIAVSRDNQWVYYGTMAHDTMFRVPVKALVDALLSDEALGAMVEAVGPKPLCDGLSTDDEGNILITDVEHSGVARMSPGGELQTLVRSDKIRWADALSFGPDGWLYVADSAIPDQMLQSKAHINARAPYFIYRFKPGAAGAAGQ